MAQRLLIALTSVIFLSTANAAEFIVKFKSADRAQQNLKLLRDADLQIVDQIPQLNIFIVESETASPALEKIRTNCEVHYVEKNGTVHTTETTPNDSSYKRQWHHRNINSAKAWDVSTGSKSVIVAVIDTGVSLNHDELKNQIWINQKEIPANGIDDDHNGYIDDVKGWDFANKDNNPEDDHGHGSHCSGLVGAQGNNGKGTVGVNWNVTIMALKFLKGSGSGTDADGAKAIVYAADNGARIISASWGSEEAAQVVADAIAYAGKKGVLFVAAAGNNKSNADRNHFYPSGFDLPNVISVGASTNSNGLADFTNYGQTSVHIASPGVDIFSTSLKNTYETMSGTSMATPIAAGVAALALAVNPNLTVTELRNGMLNAVTPAKSWSSKAATGGLIQANLMVQQLAGPVAQLWPKTMRIKVGSKLPMSAYHSTNPAWSSADSSIASVDSNGVVTGLKEGSVEIRYQNGGGALLRSTIQVVK